MYAEEKYPRNVVLEQEVVAGDLAEAGDKINLKVACDCDAEGHKEDDSGGGY
jgi:hypothetical protein